MGNFCLFFIIFLFCSFQYKTLLCPFNLVSDNLTDEIAQAFQENEDKNCHFFVNLTKKVNFNDGKLYISNKSMTIKYIEIIIQHI